MDPEIGPGSSIMESVFLLTEEGNVLFNDAVNTFFILRLYGVRHMVKYHTDSKRKPAAATWATLSD